MMAPFNRRDSGGFAVGARLVVIVIALSLAPGPGWWTLGLCAACVVPTMLVLFALLRRLPPDLPLHAMPSGAAAQAIAPSPSGAARLRVAVLPKALKHRTNLPTLI
jgi:hypothetical protein